MNLVNELQVSAEQDDVLTVLRKTKRLAAKLNRTDIAEWLLTEQQGYPDDSPVPVYRRIHATIAYETNGYLPAGYGIVMSGVQDLPGCNINPEIPLRYPISMVLSLIERPDGKNVYCPISDDRLVALLRQGFDARYARQVTFLLHINSSQLRAIPDQIKDKVLDWACALETAGVTGDGMSFTAQEKELAHSITLNIDTFNQHNRNRGDVNNAIQSD